MKDNEITKALECCSSDITSESCDDCPLNAQKVCNKDLFALEKLALDLIKRLQSELFKEQNKNSNLRNERNRLKAENERLQGELFDKTEQLKTAKAEAYKEYIEKAKKELAPFVVNVSDVCEVLDNLLKEKVGEDNA